MERAREREKQVGAFGISPSHRHLNAYFYECSSNVSIFADVMSLICISGG